jgi:hypothetical protein
LFGRKGELVSVTHFKGERAGETGERERVRKTLFLRPFNTFLFKLLSSPRHHSLGYGVSNPNRKIKR